MSEEKKANTTEVKVDTNKAAAETVAKSVYGERKKKGNFGKRRDNRDNQEKGGDEFEQKIVDIARVTRVMAGGKRMRFRACIALGNKKGKVGIGLAKGADVTLAVNKAVNKAKKNLIDVPLKNNTIPHDVYLKVGAAKIMLKPAKNGRGMIAGGAARMVLELAGIKDITSKILGTNNKVNNVKCLIKALASLKKVEVKVKEVKKEEVKKEVVAEIKK